ncbi:hypothetical protein KM799_12900 [Clostridium tyrobutyricum]|uniref:sunset domain-containing protein n=1 Tax=Clostridium tyrobutyricum TaxID=1519 RepID=UPI001C393028|nr:hypothetical protein [Clostridium tyrobutyricum]MBV4447504.1 hypothetical protein [Clostridium tyrobutyricum]
MWILYLIGIVLLIMFAKSMILNPILFKKKWQAVLGYGVPGIICLLLFFGSILLDYNAQQAYFKDQSERIASSNWQPPTVSGNVTPVKATTANSSYTSIPVTDNSDLQKGLNDLQKDLDNLQNSIDSGNANPVVASTTNSTANTASTKETTTATATITSNNAVNKNIVRDTNTVNNTSNAANIDPKQKSYVDANGKGLIKGNTSKTTGEKIYHIPGSTYYDMTKIEDTEVWFKTIQEAEAAGYRAPKR